MMKIFGLGNLTKDPEKITTNSGAIACKMNIAVNELYTKEDGTRPVQFFTVMAWNKIAENCLKYLSKGSKIAVHGNPQNRCYEDKDGVKKYIFEIVATDIEFINSVKKEEKTNEDNYEPIPIPDDDLPF